MDGVLVLCMSFVVGLIWQLVLPRKTVGDVIMCLALALAVVGCAYALRAVAPDLPHSVLFPASGTVVLALLLLYARVRRARSGTLQQVPDRCHPNAAKRQRDHSRNER
ncbi:MAG TPA: hypothetical protein VKH35_15395 [Thermoanaerobaculia bacterium]|nr:hypothetical protein [Thermoanaerobaculia bacterium]